MLRRVWKVLEVTNEKDYKVSYFRTYKKAKEYHDKTPHSELHSPGSIESAWRLQTDWDSYIPLTMIVFAATVCACFVLATLHGIGWI